MIDKELCERFKSIRKELGLNQAQFARAIGSAQSAVSNIEKGKLEPSKELLKAVMKEFNINANWLLMGGNESMIRESASGNEHVALKQKIAVLEQAIMLKENELAQKQLETKQLRHMLGEVKKANAKDVEQLIAKLSDMLGLPRTDFGIS